MKVLIVGSGQLGSRHLQALRQADLKLDITVSDPSVESLKVARERYESIPAQFEHSISYVETLPSDGTWDLAIVATNSGVRRKVLQHLYEKLNVTYIVAEKTLFTMAEDYAWAANQLGNTKAQNTWVNCCMRQMPVYQDIKKSLRTSEISLKVNGSQYGLVTNAIHYLDYACWLAGETTFTLDTSHLNTKIIESKRKGYLELTGLMIAAFANGSKATISCLPTGTLPVTVEIETVEQRFISLEAERKLLVWDQQNGWARTEKEAVIPFQSQLTKEIVGQLSKGNKPVLTTLKDSLSIHLSLLNPLQQFVKKQNVNVVEDYPFT